MRIAVDRDVLRPAQTTDSLPIVAPGVRILLVDDDPRVRRALATGLTRAGFHVFTADDGAPALELADQMTPDLVLVDFNMPTPGIEVVKALKARHGAGIWIAVLSGGEDQETREACFEAGADDVIGKPVQMPDLRRRMAAAAEAQHIHIERRLAREQADRIGGACQVRALLHAIMEDHAPQRFEVDCEESLTAELDAGLVERLLHHLIGNAVRAAMTDAVVRISAARIEHQIELQVSTEGHACRLLIDGSPIRIST